MNTFDRKFWLIFVPFLCLILLILFFPYLFTTRSLLNIDFSKTGEIGDTIGGILSPFIALAAAILTFFAFWVQFKANEQQKIDLKIERFENKFYELLRLHKSNIEELQIGKKLSGRKSFVHLFYELRLCYIICEQIIENMGIRDIKIDVMDLSYKIFFYGIGRHSDKYFSDNFNQYEKNAFGIIKTKLEKIQKFYSLNYDKSNPDKIIYYRDISNDRTTTMLYYFPFDGHVNKLSHYFRHLFQTANFIIDQDDKLLSKSQKYEYIKTLRAQLSNYEQLLMYYNAVAWFDDEWRELFTKHRLIKNLPLPLADFYKNPTEYYRKEIIEFKKKNIRLFNWQ